MQYTDIYEAINKDDAEGVVQFLPEHLEDMYRCGMTPLVYACYHDKIDIVALLLSWRPDLNKKDRNDWTVLHWICYCQNKHSSTILKMLLEHNPDINVQDCHGQTPYHISCGMGNSQTGLILLKHGANYEIKDKKGLTGIDVVCSYTENTKKQAKRIKGALMKKLKNHLKEQEKSKSKDLRLDSASLENELVF